MAIKRFLHAAALAAICLSAMSFVVEVDSLPSQLEGESMYIRSKLDDRVIDSLVVAGPSARFSGEMERPEWCEICYTHSIKHGRRTWMRPIFIGGGNDSARVVITDYYNGKMLISGSGLNSDYAAFIAHMNSLAPTDQESMMQFVGYAMDLARANKDNAFGAFLASFMRDAVEPQAWMSLYDSMPQEIKEYLPIARAHEQIAGRLSANAGDMFKDIRCLSADGSPASLSDYIGKGKHVLVDFWASWCGPCRMEAKQTLMPLYEKYKDDDRLTLLGVMTSDSPEAHLAALPGAGYPWPQLVDADNAASAAYGFDAIPMIILFAPDGTIAARDIRGQEIWQAVEAALSSSSESDQ